MHVGGIIWHQSKFTFPLALLTCRDQKPPKEAHVFTTVVIFYTTNPNTNSTERTLHIQIWRQTKDWFLKVRKEATHHHQRKLLHCACVSFLLDSFLLAVAAPALLAAPPPWKWLTLREQGVGCIWVLGQPELQQRRGGKHSCTQQSRNRRRGERQTPWQEEKWRWSQGLRAQYATDRQPDSFLFCSHTLPSQNKNTHALYLLSPLTPACWSPPPSSFPFSLTIHSVQPILVGLYQPIGGKRRNSRP